MTFVRFLKDWTLAVSIFLGVGLYLLFALTPALDAAGTQLAPLFERLLPLTIFATLFVTFSKIEYRRLRLRRWHLYVLAVQLALVGLVLALISISTLTGEWQRWVILLLEAILICIIAPCASASPVVVSKLGGDLTQMTAFVLLSSLVTSLLIPLVFPLVEPHAGSTFATAFLAILRRLASVLLLPLALGFAVHMWVRPLYAWIERTPDLAFYLWTLSLGITSGLTARNIATAGIAPAMLVAIAALSLLTSWLQLGLGHLVGHLSGELISARQAMFQKNTGLAIWIAFVYLTPEASVSAGCYVLWQNLINSYELWQRNKATPVRK